MSFTPAPFATCTNTHMLGPDGQGLRDSSLGGLNEILRRIYVSQEPKEGGEGVLPECLTKEGLEGEAKDETAERKEITPQ